MHLSRIKVLVLGAGGMLGSTLVRYLALKSDVEVYGSARAHYSISGLPLELQSVIRVPVNAQHSDDLTSLFADIRPDVVINCIGLVKQLAASNNPLICIPINSVLPHRLASLCSISKARLIHFSTDCVFSGSSGMYKESDSPDAVDLYGLSKLLGEPNHVNTITLRTSLIGHELIGKRSLVSWFLSQSGSVQGFRRAIFSGLPTVEIARVVHELVLPNTELRGLYHLSVDPISKYELLSLISQVYKHDIQIYPEDEFIIDRSLDSSRFRLSTGFLPKPWIQLIRQMHDFR